MSHTEPSNHSDEENLDDVEIAVVHPPKQASNDHGAGGSTNSDAASAGSSSNTASGNRKMYVFGLVAFLMIAAAVLLPTLLVVKNNRDDDDSSSSGLIFDLSDTIPVLGGEVVKMSAAGRRLFVQKSNGYGGAEDGTNDKDQQHTMEVYDFENGEWVRKANLLAPPSVDSSLRIEAFDIDDKGERMVVTTTVWPTSDMSEYQVTVQVLQDTTGQGTTWEVYGNVLTSEMLQELPANSPVFCQDASIPRDVVVRSHPGYFGRTLTMSGDGYIFGVSDTKADIQGIHCLNGTYYDRNVGAVQVFRHVGHLGGGNWSEPESSTTDQTWLPMGQMLLGEFKNDELGSRIRFSEDGQRMVVTENLLGDERFGQARIFDYNWETKLWKDVGYETVPPVFYEHKDSEVIDISADGRVIAIADPDYRMSSDSPRRGQVTLFYDTGNFSFGQIDLDKFTLFGEGSFQHFGTTMALAQYGSGDETRYSIVVGSEAFPYSEGDHQLRVYHSTMNATTPFEWELKGTARGHSQIPNGWVSSAISRSGSRIAALGLNERGEMDNVHVFDVVNEE